MFPQEFTTVKSACEKISLVTVLPSRSVVENTFTADGNEALFPIVVTIEFTCLFSLFLEPHATRLTQSAVISSMEHNFFILQIPFFNHSRMPRHSCCEVRVMQLHDILLLCFKFRTYRNSFDNIIECCRVLSIRNNGVDSLRSCKCCCLEFCTHSSCSASGSRTSGKLVHFVVNLINLFNQLCIWMKSWITIVESINI